MLSVGHSMLLFELFGMCCCSCFKMFGMCTLGSNMAYVAMSRRSYFTKPLSAESESLLHTMSLSQLQIKLLQTKLLQTKLLQKQEALEERDRETQAQMKEEYEQYEKSLRLKRQSNRLKEPNSKATAFSKQMKDRHEMITQDKDGDPSLPLESQTLRHWRSLKGHMNSQVRNKG